jgi:hypothetical protein
MDGFYTTKFKLDMKPTKIEMTPAMREYNEAVEMADLLTDYRHDTEPAKNLLGWLEQEQCYPNSVQALKVAMANLAVKRCADGMIEHMRKH